MLYLKKRESHNSPLHMWDAIDKDTYCNMFASLEYREEAYKVVEGNRHNQKPVCKNCLKMLEAYPVRHLAEWTKDDDTLLAMLVAKMKNTK